jgi:hypothetical protein
VLNGALSINNRGHIVGDSRHLSGFIRRSKKMQSLDALINQASGWDIRDARASDDAGQIAANAWRNGVRQALRLDLIKPHADAVPPAEHDEEPSVEAPLSPQAAAEGGAGRSRGYRERAGETRAPVTHTVSVGPAASALAALTRPAAVSGSSPAMIRLMISCLSSCPIHSHALRCEQK